MKGIYNIGNSCYLNSAIQLLFNSIDFRQICYNTDIYNIIKSYDSNTIFNPNSIKSLVANKYKQFNNTNQQDSFEFLVYFLDIIDSFNHNLLYKKFGMKTTINIKCKMLNCEYESEHIETDLFLQLPIANDLSDAYRLYKQTELLDNDNKYYCEKCKKKTIARKNIIMSKWSDNLIIILKRFDNMMRKDNRMVNIPLEWRHGYMLQGGIIHMGSTNGGHYIYFGKDTNNWYIANDMSISKINNINDFMSNQGSTAYILYYVKSTGL